MSDETLLPCPFCKPDEQDLFEECGIITCRNCGAWRATIAAWNTRPADAKLLELSLNLANEVTLRREAERERDRLRKACEAVLLRDSKWALSGMKNDCGCIGLSRDAEREYEMGQCPHQLLREALGKGGGS